MYNTPRSLKLKMHSCEEFRGFKVGTPEDLQPPLKPIIYAIPYLEKPFFRPLEGDFSGKD